MRPCRKAAPILSAADSYICSVLAALVHGEPHPPWKNESASRATAITAPTMGAATAMVARGRNPATPAAAAPAAAVPTAAPIPAAASAWLGLVRPGLVPPAGIPSAP